MPDDDRRTTSGSTTRTGMRKLDVRHGRPGRLMTMTVDRLGQAGLDRGVRPARPELPRCPSDRRRLTTGRRAGLSGRACCRACPSCWSAPGPWASGSSSGVASSALSRCEHVGDLGGLDLAPELLVTCLTSLGSGTWPSPLPTTTSWIGVSLATRSCLRRSAASSGREPVGVALADQDDAGRADDAVHDVLLLGEADAGSTFQPRRSISARRRRRPGWPSIWSYGAFWARRPKTISAARMPIRSAPTTIESQLEDAASRAADQKSRSRRRRRAGTTPSGPQARCRSVGFGHLVGLDELLAPAHLLRSGAGGGHRGVATYCRVGGSGAQVGARASMA